MQALRAAMHTIPVADLKEAVGVLLTRQPGALQALKAVSWGVF